MSIVRAPSLKECRKFNQRETGARNTHSHKKIFFQISSIFSQLESFVCWGICICVFSQGVFATRHQVVKPWILVLASQLRHHHIRKLPEWLQSVRENFVVVDNIYNTYKYKYLLILVSVLLMSISMIAIPMVEPRSTIQTSLSRLNWLFVENNYKRLNNIFFILKDRFLPFFIF